jgi:hypothetical protein
VITSSSFNENFRAPYQRRDAEIMAANAWAYDMLAASPSPARKLKTFFGDATLIAAGWGLLIGVVVYPEAQLVGVAACAVALFFTRKN